MKCVLQMAGTHRRGLWRLLLAAIAAVLVGLLGAGTASAATVPNAETRVGASTPVTAYVVGPHECIAAGQHRANSPPQCVSMAGCCVAANTAERVAVNGETTATKLGREMHASWDYGPGFEKEFRLPSGKRVDGINFETRQVVELKPNNPRQIRLGQRQVDGYVDELNQAYPGDSPWPGSVVTYGAP